MTGKRQAGYSPSHSSTLPLHSESGGTRVDRGRLGEGKEEETEWEQERRYYLPLFVGVALLEGGYFK